MAPTIESPPVPCDRSTNHLHRRTESAYCIRSLIRRVVVDQRTPFPVVAPPRSHRLCTAAQGNLSCNTASPWIIVQRCCQQLHCYIEHEHTHSIADCTSWPAARAHSDPPTNTTQTPVARSDRTELDYGQSFGVWRTLWRLKLTLCWFTLRWIVPTRCGRQRDRTLLLSLPFYSEQSHSPLRSIASGEWRWRK